MRVHSGNKVSFIILCDARLTVHVMQTSREVYVAWVPVQSEHRGLPSSQQVSAVGLCRLVVLKMLHNQHYLKPLQPHSGATSLQLANVDITNTLLTADAASKTALKESEFPRSSGNIFPITLALP